MARITNREIPSFVGNALAFTANNVTGEAKHGYSNYYGSALPQDWVLRLRFDHFGVGINYVVYSYATPIAWRRADAVWVVPNVKYSPVTSRHQSLVRRGIAGSTIIEEV